MNRIPATIGTGMTGLFFSMGQAKQHDHTNQYGCNTANRKKNTNPGGKTRIKEEACGNQECPYQYCHNGSHYRFCHPGTFQ
jgi:hypothetical protein